MKITGKQRVLNHKERHPNDKNERNLNFDMKNSPKD